MLYLLLTEHLLLIMKYVVSISIPDQPKWVKYYLEKEQILRDVEKKTHASERKDLINIKKQYIDLKAKWLLDEKVKNEDVNFQNTERKGVT